MTKRKILIVSSKLFYEHGIANVRLQQIADEANISVGNLAYHYKNKESIVYSLYEEIFTELNKILDGEIHPQHFADFDKSIKSLYKFTNEYNFCFINVWEIARNYPQLQEQWESANSSLLSIIYKRIYCYIQTGLLGAESYKGAYKMLSHHLLMNMLSWIPYRMLSGKTASLQSFRKSTWSLLVPHLTQKGVIEYKKLGVTNN